ncbi:hypothetical protein IJC60_00405 [bacterium]|nr:hypothetical protein [bacterium]
MKNNIFKRTLTTLYEKFAKNDNTARLIIVASTGCMILASIANLIGISIDRKTSKEEKLFLLPQEAADGVLNIGLYYFCSEAMRKAAVKAVDSGKVIFKDVAKNSPEFVKGREGVALVASIIGSIVSSNIITPIIRNAIGAKARSKMLKETGKKAPETPDYIVRPMPKVPNAPSVQHLNTTPLRIDRVPSGLRV